MVMKTQDPIVPSSASDHPGSTPVSGVGESVSPQTPEQINYAKRRLPHFERPWGKYAISFSSRERHPLAPNERGLVLQSILYGHERNHYELYAACIMPDHVHLLLEPQIKEQDDQGRTIFWALSDILHGIKSSSAHRINKVRGTSGAVWEKESFDRLVRSEADLHEKFRYICRNPWDSGVADPNEDYLWLWTNEMSSAGAPKTTREGACAPRKFAIRNSYKG
jgi:REP element-mobilizing transposase RayT